jgi:hypothetical protein
MLVFLLLLWLKQKFSLAYFCEYLAKKGFLLFAKKVYGKLRKLSRKRNFSQNVL